jgi:hypothetical protein
MSIQSRKPILVCKICRNFGFTGRIPPAEGTIGWFAEDVFELGVPCSCSIGQYFAVTQEEWKKPIPEGREDGKQ